MQSQQVEKKPHSSQCTLFLESDWSLPSGQSLATQLNFRIFFVQQMYKKCSGIEVKFFSNFVSENLISCQKKFHFNKFLYTTIHWLHTRYIPLHTRKGWKFSVTRDQPLDFSIPHVYGMSFHYPLTPLKTMKLSSSIFQINVRKVHFLVRTVLSVCLNAVGAMESLIVQWKTMKQIVVSF